MVKRHIKRLNAPKTWRIQRRNAVFTTRSNPGGMSNDMTLPIANILKYELKLAGSIKDVKHLIFAEDIHVNGRKVTDYKHPVCFTDVVSFPKLNQNYRLIIDTDNILKLIPISKEEAGLKIVKIIGKNYIKGKIQLNLFDGRNVLFEKHHYKVSDSLLLTIPEQVVKEHLSLEKGMLVLLCRGNHVGKIGTLQEIKGKSVIVKTGDDVYETKNDYVLVVGKDRPLVKMTK
jgi:small subunit ribosomal protein S4e